MCKEADCSHGCALVGDTVKCQCFEGMVLDTDEKTCIGELSSHNAMMNVMWYALL